MIFQFSLQKLLDIKVQEERQQLVILGERQQKLRQEQECLWLLKQKHIEYTQQLAEKKNGFSGEYQIYNNYFPLLQQKIDFQQNTCRQVEQEITELLTTITQLVKERKTLERLKEKKYEKHLAEMVSKEQRQLDEVALSRFFQQKNQWR